MIFSAQSASAAVFIFIAQHRILLFCGFVLDQHWNYLFSPKYIDCGLFLNTLKSWIKPI